MPETEPFLSRFFIALICLALLGCAGPLPGQPHPYEDYLNKKGLDLPSPDKFQHCQSYGCATRSDVGLTKREWARVTAPFKNAKTPTQERAAVAHAVGVMEQIVGKKTGTDNDRPGTFEKTGPGQLDCVDESINTTLTLAMLDRKKILKFHTVSTPAHRTPGMTMGRGLFWPHQSATIFETKTNTAYAVDSWFRANGENADIVPLSEWASGWVPDIAIAER
jgi:hypothetical protein